MKLLCSILFAAAVLAPSDVMAQFPKSINNLIVSLTLSYTTPGTVAKDGDTGKVIQGGNSVYENHWTIQTATKYEQHYEFMAKIGTRKYGNKEFLQDLLAAEILPGDTIAGWSIVQVIPTFEAEDGPRAGETYFYAINRNSAIAPVNLSEVIQQRQAFGFAFAETLKWALKATAANPTTPTTSLNDTYNWKATQAFLIDFTDGEEAAFAFIQGISTGSARLGSVGTGADRMPLYIFGAGKISAISGDAIDSERPGQAVVEGSITIAPGKADQPIGQIDLR